MSAAVGVAAVGIAVVGVAAVSLVDCLLCNPPPHPHVSPESMERMNSGLFPSSPRLGGGGGGC